MSNTKHKLPTLAELHETDLQTAYKQDQLNLLLSSPPNKAWLKKHPLIKVKNDKGQFVALEYLPADKLEFLLNKIFGRWRTEVLREGQLFNSVFAVVRLHYFNPVTEAWEMQDGVGAVGVQTDAGASAGDLAKIKQDAVMKALPSAVSYAFKNACKRLGALFGGDLNLVDTETYTPTFVQPDTNNYAPPSQPVQQQQPAPVQQQSAPVTQPAPATLVTAGPDEIQF